MRRSTERGFTLVEIMIVVAIIALLAAMAIPNVLRGRTTANEAAAIGNMRALVSSQEMYRSANSGDSKDGASWITNMYPGVATPGTPNFGPPSFNHVMDGTAAALTQGYLYSYLALPVACTDALLNCQTYGLVGVPQTLNQTGTRSIFIDDTGVVRHCTGATVIPLTAALVTTMQGKATIDQGPSATCT